MAQHRYLDFHAPRTGANMNAKIGNTLPAVLTQEMSASKGTGDFDVTLGAGAWVNHEGIAVVEDAALTDIVTLDDPDASDRIDVIYGTLAYEADTEPTPASYGVKQGTPGANPSEPSLASDEVKLVAIYVPSDASDLDDCYICEAGPLKAWLSSALGFKLEASVFKRAVGDPFVTATSPTVAEIYQLGIKDGDIWVETGGLDIYVYDASSNEWVAGDVLAHATTHWNNGSDEVDLKDLADSLGFRHLGNRDTHEAFNLRHTMLASVGEDDHHAKLHKSNHSAGGADPVDLKDIADTEGYRHKTHPGYAPSPHGDAHHSETYSLNPHAHDNHSGVIAAGFIGGGGVVSPTADTPTGSNVFQWEVPDFDIEDTTLYYTALRVKVTTAPSAGIVFTFKLNGGAFGTVTVAEGQTVGTTDISPDVEITAGDVIQLDGPVAASGAKGCIPSIAIARVGA